MTGVIVLYPETQDRVWYGDISFTICQSLWNRDDFHFVMQKGRDSLAIRRQCKGSIERKLLCSPDIDNFQFLFPWPVTQKSRSDVRA